MKITSFPFSAFPELVSSLVCSLPQTAHVFRGGIVSGFNHAGRKVFPLREEFKAQWELGALTFDKTGETRLK